MVSKVILDSYKQLSENFKIKVNLTYFKESGKYYGEGSYMEDYLSLFEIWDRVVDMEVHPGLSGKWGGWILIEVLDHIHAHPHMINMGENK